MYSFLTKSQPIEMKNVVPRSTTFRSYKALPIRSLTLKVREGIGHGTTSRIGLSMPDGLTGEEE